MANEKEKSKAESSTPPTSLVNPISQTPTLPVLPPRDSAYRGFEANDASTGEGNQGEEELAALEKRTAILRKIQQTVMKKLRWQPYAGA